MAHSAGFENHSCFKIALRIPPYDESVINSDGIIMRSAQTDSPVSPAAAAFPSQPRLLHLDARAPRRADAEAFIGAVFARRYGATINNFAPQLLLFEHDGRPLAAAGWRGAESGPLFLEAYLPAPIETVLAGVAGQPLARRRIVEVGHLASQRAGAGLQLIGQLARHLERADYEWVVFTATQELIGIFARLSLPLLALAKADPARLGREAAGWGRYYESDPVVVAGRIRLALDR